MLVMILAKAREEIAPGQSGVEAVDITGFLDVAGTSDADATFAVRKALTYCKQNGIKKLTFPKGVYHFRKDLAWESLISITNNDSGAKRIAFLLDGFENFEIDGGGSLFIFHGFLNPFVIENSKHITLRNFLIDYDRTFHSEGKILAVGDGTVDVAFNSEFPYKISQGLLTFTGKPGDATTEFPTSSLLEFDSAKRETAYMVPDYFVGRTIHASELGAGQVRVEVKDFHGTLGNTLVFGAASRLVPGIVIQDSADVNLLDLTIHHAGGMGIIAQRSRDLSLTRVKVVPSGDRMVSTTADATHFANCSGKVSLVDCVFENQMDDATNIHGIYVKITRQLSNKSLEVRLIHPQQFGFDFLHPGQKVELVHSASLITYGEEVVESVERLNSEVTRLSFQSPLPPALQINDVLSATDSQPEVLIQGCTIGNNRARGILLGSRGRIVVKDNWFHTPGAAILLEGDGSFWFEQAGVRDLTIQGNDFHNCNYGTWGNGVIQVGAGIKPDQRVQSRYNRGIVIDDNLFEVFDGTPLVNGYCIDGLSYGHNRIEKTTAYPPHRNSADRFEITNSDHVVITP